MGPCNCAVFGCHNSWAKLKKWEMEGCTVHVGLLQKDCPCEQPFRLYKFPAGERNAEKRSEWIRLMKRETVNKKAWQPAPSARVCSEHFVDSIPTAENPNPTLKLGYDIKEKKERRQLFRKPLATTSKSTDDSSVLLSPPMSPPPTIPRRQLQEVPSSSTSANVPTTDTHENCSSKDCTSCSTLVSQLKHKIDSLTKQVKNLKMNVNKQKQLNEDKKPFSYKFITTDKKMNFYTGISSIVMFEMVFSLIAPFIPKLQHWRSKSMKQVSQKVKPKYTHKNPRMRKLTPRDALLLTLMRLRLGLLNEDLADRFCLSTATCSNTFKTYIRLLSKTVGKLVKWLPQESILENMPKIYRKAGYGKVRVILDCTEVFIERSKSLNVQALTWSDYKSHNTIKVLVGISPTGYITFLSDCYGGRASDRFICNDSGIFDLLDPYDHVMADRGFQIQEELLLKMCTLAVPPGARLKSQMTEKEVKKTQEIANLRIHVERAINRMKTYRILKNVMPLTMLHHCDDIVKVCGALCNLKPLLFKESEKTE